MMKNKTKIGRKFDERAYQEAAFKLLSEWLDHFKNSLLAEKRATKISEIKKMAMILKKIEALRKDKRFYY